MARMLILIPVMYSKEKLKEILGVVPKDFEESSSEFWDYIETKLDSFMMKINIVYSSKTSPIDNVKNRMDLILKNFEGSAQHIYMDDPLLTAEAEAWLEMAKKHSNQAVLDLFEENLKEMNKYTSELIEKTLKDGEVGVIFTDLNRKLSFLEDIKIIKMCPFDPIDYLNRHKAILHQK